MPAQADIQEDAARASGYASWIPGLAVLARNDEASVDLTLLKMLTVGLLSQPHAVRALDSYTADSVRARLERK